MNTVVYYIYAALIMVGLVGALIFPIMYTIKAKWWRTAIGVDVFTFSSLFALLYVRSGLTIFDQETREVLAGKSIGNVIFYMFLAVVGAGLVWFRVWNYIDIRSRKANKNGPGPRLLGRISRRKQD